MSTFLSGEQLSREIGKLLKEGGARCAVAFWGKGASEKFSGKTSGLKLICNLRSGGTNPFEIEKLPRNAIKQCDTLHAKVCIGAARAVVSSANISCNGLGLEDIEQARWIEAGVLLQDISTVSNWFDDMWDDARPISDNDLKAANELWKKRQRSKPTLLSFRDFDPETTDVPLLYWIADHDWEYGRGALLELGGGEAAQCMIDNSLEVGPSDREAMRPGKWIMVYEISNSGRPKRRPRPYWFFTGRLIEKSFRYAGQKQYLDSVLCADVLPPSPFDLREPQTLDVIFDTLFDNKFRIFSGDFHYTPNIMHLTRSFWKTCKERYDRSSVK
jgi:hypothetical protein